MWWLLRRPWLLGAALVAAGVIVVGGWLAGALVLGLAVSAWPAFDAAAGPVRPPGVSTTAAGADGIAVSAGLGPGQRPVRPDQGTRRANAATRICCGSRSGSVSDRLLLRMVTGQSHGRLRTGLPGAGVLAERASGAGVGG